MKYNMNKQIDNKRRWSNVWGIPVPTSRQNRWHYRYVLPRTVCHLLFVSNLLTYFNVSHHLVTQTDLIPEYEWKVRTIVKSECTNTTNLVTDGVLREHCPDRPRFGHRSEIPTKVVDLQEHTTCVVRPYVRTRATCPSQWRPCEYLTSRVKRV